MELWRSQSDIVSQSDNLLLQGERKSRGGSLSMDLWSWPGGTSASPGLAQFAQWRSESHTLLFSSTVPSYGC